MSTDSSKQINDIFESNRLKDLQTFLSKRSCLNNCNIVLIYLFHIIQSIGILTTTIATGYNIREYIWIGIGLNILASLINIFEKTNNSLSLKLLSNIKAIKNNNYVDETILVDDDDIEKKLPTNITPLLHNNNDNYSSTNL